MENVLISVVIPVHNGEKYIKKAVKSIISQSLGAVEVILVENFSSDGSLNLCKSLAEEYKNVIFSQSFEKGTTYARKRGVEIASGEYITFCDQDDYYITKTALEEMYNTIKDRKAQLCQFGHFAEIVFGIRKKSSAPNDKNFTRHEFFQNQFRGFLSSKNSEFNGCVFNKIYDAGILKSAESKMNKSFFYGEDIYLNLLFLLDENVKIIFSSSACYYSKRFGNGYASSIESVNVLIDEYEFIKPFAIDIVNNNSLNSEILYDYHLETVYLLMSIVRERIKSKSAKEDILRFIEKTSSNICYTMAKDYFRNYKGDKHNWPELEFIISDFSPIEYYDYCVNSMPKESLKQKLIILLRKLS